MEAQQNVRVRVFFLEGGGVRLALPCARSYQPCVGHKLANHPVKAQVVCRHAGCRHGVDVVWSVGAEVAHRACGWQCVSLHIIAHTRRKGK